MANFKYKQRPIFYIQQRLTEYRFEELSSFVDHSRSAMKAAWETFSKKFDQTTAGWTAEKTDAYVNHIYDDMAQLRDASPQLLRHAQCMVIYGTFENSLADLCRVVYRDGRIADPPKDKLYMSDAKGYLRPHFGTRPAPFTKHWDWLDEFRVIRNWMAHNGGRIQEDTQPDGNWSRAQRFVRRNRGLIKFGQHGAIVVENGLVDRALGKATVALDRIERATKRLYR